MIIITLQITSAIPKSYISSSDESIENLLYFKDCQYKRAEPPVPLRAAEPPVTKEPECRFPRMCCSLTCDNTECNQPQSFVTRQGSASANVGNSQTSLPKPVLPVQPHLPAHPIAKKSKKKEKTQPKMQPPIGGRRDFGFTKDKIKGLISSDNDIRKILKDLVRVTMQKVNLQEVINARKNENMMPEETENSDDGTE